MPQEKFVIEIRDVTKRFGTFTALGAVSVSIRENEFFTLLGPSGCGKTTLLRLIAGFESASDGEIRLNGKDIAALPPYLRPVNTVFQNYALFPHMTVAENIGFGLEMLGKSAAETGARVDEMLRLVRMEELKHRRTTELSGGQQQRVALARALAPAPKVLLLDEPLSALDYKLRKEMQIELKNLQLKTGITFIFVTHDQEEALAMSDRIAVLSTGQILQVGDPREIYDSPRERFVAEFIGEANFLDGAIVAARDGRAQVRLASGAEITARLPANAPQDGKVTVFVRPEHAKVHAGDRHSSLAGTLESVVYLGTDTHLHMRLADGTPFVVRRQNSPMQDAAFVAGARVGVTFEPDAVQVLGADHVERR